MRVPVTVAIEVGRLAKGDSTYVTMRIDCLDTTHQAHVTGTTDQVDFPSEHCQLDDVSGRYNYAEQ